MPPPMTSVEIMSCTFMPVIHTMRYIDLTYAGAPS